MTVDLRGRHAPEVEKPPEVLARLEDIEVEAEELSSGLSWAAGRVPITIGRKGRDVERVPSSASPKGGMRRHLTRRPLHQGPHLFTWSSLATLVHERSDLTLPH